MIKFKAWNAINSRAIAKFHNAEIDLFGHNAIIHELIRGSLGNLQYFAKKDAKKSPSFRPPSRNLVNAIRCKIPALTAGMTNNSSGDTILNYYYAFRELDIMPPELNASDH